ncbi:MAG: hypothetical protein HZB67_00765 [Candidatus Aenigmarchaeota archaeon]|nr:hypothetical protein [Candidatus Aenigmarchaeota archaeon]
MFEKKTNEEKIQAMMKRLNINIEKIDAQEVLIKTQKGDIVISAPEVVKTAIMGRDVYQVTGRANETAVNEDDITFVMKKTGKDRNTVVKKIEELDNDLSQAIIELKETTPKKKKRST